jgi:hypothetical protein
MAAAEPRASTASQAPRLTCAVTRVEALAPAAAPTLRFTLALDAGGATVRSLALGVQIQIAARQRRYAERDQPQLVDLFGDPARWGQTLRTLPWLRATLVTPPFDGAATVALEVPCTYDFEVAATRYLSALRDGEVPLELLFSGTVFWTGDDARLQAARIPWDCEARCAMPVRVWREAIDACFPDAAWLRLGRDAFDGLAAFRAARALPSWEATVEALLEEGRSPPAHASPEGESRSQDAGLDAPRR